jgi:hypothetical protein
LNYLNEECLQMHVTHSASVTVRLFMWIPSFLSNSYCFRPFDINNLGKIQKPDPIYLYNMLVKLYFTHYCPTEIIFISFHADILMCRCQKDKTVKFHQSSGNTTRFSFLVFRCRGLHHYSTRVHCRVSVCEKNK